jgi:hypothetical protein
MSRRLRLSGLLATAVFLVMVVSDLLMCTSLDFHRPYRFWTDAAGLPQAQVSLGYYVGELAIPFLCVTTAWHLSLAIRPAGRWASWMILAATAYCAPLIAVWHASFAFTRSVLRAELAVGAMPGGPGTEALLAYSTYALPLFRIGLGVAGLAYVIVFGLILSGRTLYPRSSGVVLPAVYVLLAYVLEPFVPLRVGVVLDAAGWNVAGAAMFGLSTVILWSRDA